MDDDQIVEEESKDSDKSKDLGNVEETLTKAKADLEAKEEVEDENPADTSSEEESEDAEKETPTFTKKFPNIKGDTPEEYATNLEIAYGASFKELHRLRDESKTSESEDPALSYAQQLYQRDVNTAWSEVQEKYPQVADLDNFQKFEKAVGPVATTLTISLGRAPTLAETYLETCKQLGWEATDSKEDLGAAVKNAASDSKVNSATKPAEKSKISDKQIEAARHFYPNKTDSEIRQELEKYAK